MTVTNTNHVPGHLEMEIKFDFFSMEFFFVSVESPLHSDLQKLRSMLIETHLADLRDQTHEIHYEAFRSACITRLTSVAAAQQPHRERKYTDYFFTMIIISNFCDNACLFVSFLQTKYRSCSKLKRDSMLVELPDDDRATDLILQQKEEEIRKMQDMLAQMQHQLQVQQRSRSLGETQLKHDFSLIKNEKSQEVHL